MTRIVTTTVVRLVGQEIASGFICVLDLESHKLLTKIPVPESRYRASDPNPRGGLRGGRGLAVYGDRLVVANTERLLIFDSKWRLINDISHPLMAGVHDIIADAEGIWVTCSAADMLIKMDWEGRLIAEWEWREDSTLKDIFGLSRVPRVDRRLDYRDPESMRDGVRNIVHLNSITKTDGDLALSFGRILSQQDYGKAIQQSWIGWFAKRMGVKRRTATGMREDQIIKPTRAGSSYALVLLDNNGKTRILRQVKGTKVPNHNVIRFGDDLIYNDTNNGCSILVALKGDRSDRVIQIPGENRFLRGLVQLDEEHILVGNKAPLTIYKVNRHSGRIVDTFLLGGEPNEAIFAICILPQEFGDPPSRLE
jgi:hypothetical protein